VAGICSSWTHLIGRSPSKKVPWLEFCEGPVEHTNCIHMVPDFLLDPNKWEKASLARLCMSGMSLQHG